MGRYRETLAVAAARGKRAPADSTMREIMNGPGPRSGPIHFWIIVYAPPFCLYALREVRSHHLPEGQYNLAKGQV
jgi:hypothetical protein